VALLQKYWSLSVPTVIAKGHEMFDILTQGFKDASLKLKGQARLTPENIGPALDQVRTSLLNADVDLQVVKEFL
jgi:signal recognition particle subunit SRP54